MAEIIKPRRCIYGVSVAGQPVRLVRARSQSQALQFVVGTTVFIGRPTEEQLIDLTKQGVEVEDIPSPAELLAAAQAEITARQQAEFEAEAAARTQETAEA